jgi:8-oxo-dGTP pyrophosphatase MutT (NUDIX family)
MGPETMTAVDKLWYMADEAGQQAAQTYHRLTDEYEDFLEFERSRSISRERFRTLAARISENGLPYGAHSIVGRPSGELLLVRHEGVGRWVVPGGEACDGETLPECARRELREEAGVEDATYDGLGVLVQVRVRADGHETWGVLPVFEATVTETDLEVRDPDGELSDARWFDELPADTRDRAILRPWRRERG